MKLFITFLALVAVTMADEKSSEQLLNAGNNLFTARMFSEVVKSKPDKSVILSGFSVLTPLAQLGLASVGASHDELLKAIGLPNDETTKEVFSLVNKQVRSVKGVDLKMANRVYIPEGYELNDDFAAVSRDVFGSEVKNVDFSKNQETAKAINTWVESQTNNRIKDLVSAQTLTPNTKAVLVNALYFKGTWNEKFDPALTTDRDFHVTKQKTIQLPTMHRNGNYRYAESSELNAKLIELPYEGDESSLLVILPNEIDGLAALEEKLKDPNSLVKATQNMYEYEVDLYLPKFKIETTTDLKEVLQNIDVKKLFTAGEAKLEKLLKNASDLYVSEAIQKAFIEVNEEGAEAAAANAFVGLGASPFARPPPIPFQVDRPFYFEITVNNSIRIFNGIMTFSER